MFQDISIRHLMYYDYITHDPVIDFYEYYEKYFLKYCKLYKRQFVEIDIMRELETKSHLTKVELKGNEMSFN
jgi:hypothetical protein